MTVRKPETSAPPEQAAGQEGSHPLQGQELAELRHDLRTPINHILGYSEMLIEEAQEQGRTDCATELEKLHRLGQEMLTVINDALSPSRDTVSQQDLSSLARALEEPIQGLLKRGTALLEEMKPLGLEEFSQDIEKILAAGARLRALAEARLLQASVRAQAGRTEDVLPPSPDVSEQQKVNPEPPEAGEEPAEAGRLLVVDDDEGNRDMLSRHLKRQGHTVTMAANGSQALEMIKTRGYDLVLLDVLMPGINGYEVLAQVKSDPATRDIPVIMISALDELESVVQCIETGAEDYLPKPFDPVLLRARIGACLEKKRLREHELEYLRNVAAVATAAAAVESGEFNPDSLTIVGQRTDELGRLARVFQHMAIEVRNREQRLKMQVHKLQIEIDETRKAHQVAEITETGYFQELQQKAQELKKRKRS